MKNLITILFFLLSFSAFSQRTADRFMTLGCSISQSGASSGKPHVSCNCVDQGGTYDASNVQVGDSLMFVDGGVGYKVPIDSIVTPGAPTVVVRVDWTGLGLVMIPTGSGAISSAATNGIDVDVAGLSDGDAQVFKEDNVANLDFNNNRTYVTSDSFSTFVPATPVPQEGDLALRLLTGNLYQKISGNWVRKSLENGTTTASIYSAGSVDTLTWNGNLYRHVRVNAGTRDTVHIDFPTNMATQFVGSTYLIGVQNSTNVLTVTWDTLYGTFDLTDMPPQTVGVNNTINYEFRVVSGGSEGVRLQWVDGGIVGVGLTDGDKGDVDVTDSGTVWTIDTSAVEWGNLSSAVQDSINAGVLTLFENYDSLINYSGSATIALVKDFETTSGWLVKGGIFYQVPSFIGKTVSQSVDYGTRFTDSSGRKWQRDFDGINFYPEFWRVDSTKAYAGTAGWYADGSEALYQLQSSATNYYFYDAATGNEQVGETINLTPGKTYESTVQVPMHPYLKINGNGATIIRKTPETTTSADTTLASTAFVIVPAGGTAAFRPNMVISVQRAGDANGGLGENENTGFRSIVSFGRANAGDNDTIFVASNWIRGATTGSIVYSGAHTMFVTSGNNRDAGATIKNLNIDGNKANHTYSLSWLSGASFSMPIAKNNLIEGCFFKDIHCENIYIAGGEVRNCSFRDLEGSFSHQSALDTFSLLFQNIRGDSVCLAGTLSGHAGACFETSVGAFGSVTIRDCHITNGKTKVIGSYSNDDANIFVDNLTAKNFDEIHSNNGAIGSFTIQNSIFDNCGDLFLKATSIADTVAYVKVNNNYFVNTRFLFTKVATLQFSNNTVSWTPSKFTGYSTGIESAFNSAIAVNNPISNIEIYKNYFWADSTYNSSIASLIYFSVATTTIAGKTVYRGQMTFKDNKVYNFGRLSANSLSSDYDYIGWEFSDNEIWSNPSSAQYVGTAGLLNLVRGQKFLRNRVVNQTPASTTYMVTAYGILSTSIDTTTSIGSIMIDNIFEGKGCTYICGSGSWPYNCFAKGNITRANPIVSNKSTSIDNTVINSILLPALTAPSTITRVPYLRPADPGIKIIR